MYEVELKVRADLDRVRERLGERGAERAEAVVQTDTYYDAPHRAFAATDEAFRIRREESEEGGSSAVMTYKGPKVDPDSKTREEIETGVADGDTAGAIFEALGFDPVATVRKERERYRYGGYTVTLDDVEDVGTFVEVEGEAAVDGEATAGDDAVAPKSETVEDVREGAKAVLRDLHLDPDGQIRTSYLGLLLGDAGE